MKDTNDRRALVVEDEPMIVLIIEEILDSLGFAVVGPASELDDAVRLAREESFHAAILDVTICGGEVFPVAKILQERGIPFILTTGHNKSVVPGPFRDCKCLRKPYTPAQLEDALSEVCAPR